MLNIFQNFTPDLKVILMDVGTAYSVHIVTSVIEIITSIAWSCNTSPNLEVVASIRVTGLSLSIIQHLFNKLITC